VEVLGCWSGSTRPLGTAYLNQPEDAFLARVDIPSSPDPGHVPLLPACALLLAADAAPEVCSNVATVVPAELLRIIKGHGASAPKVG
jgi:hypothetical protein